MLNIKKIIGIIMILAGILIIASAAFMKYQVYEHQKAILNSFKNVINKPISESVKKPENIIIDNKSIIGIIDIPKINLEAGIAEGVDLESLKYAVGHFSGTPLPGQKGNFCLAGHRSYTYGQFFNRLDELEVGDEIIIKTNSNQYIYKVYEKKVVEPTEVSVLNNTKDDNITLVTCTPIRIATHRLIIKGKLKS